jgi:TaqI-like C-terminal specificity domain/Eco57I restriction-modification methylase
MIAAELKQHFQKPYHFDNWEGVFRQLFRQLDLLATPQHLFENIESVKQGFQFGTAILDDGKKLALFEVEVSDNVKIANNRVTLRNIASQYIDQFITHGALVLYYSKKQKDYRFTFIAKQSEFDEEGALLKTETNPKRFTYVLGENETCSTAAKQFEILFRKNKSLVIKDFIEAFSVEKLSKDFFKDYRNKHYSGFIAYLTGENADGKIINPPHESLERVFDNNQKAARDFVKKLLGRFVFMQFLQKKRWLGCPKHLNEWVEGDLAFMQNLFKNNPNKDFFHSRCLSELFHNTLNNDRKETNYLFPLTDSRVPYLNGGLFDRENLETYTIDFPPQYFGDLLDFFDQYNFTIDENDPEEQEVGIDPEMLGHIFENLLEDNKDKGAFYTPKEIVQYMCQESLIQYLKTHFEEQNTEGVSSDDIEFFVRKQDLPEAFKSKKVADRVEGLLENVKICDPAIGSGAFPIGLLQIIFRLRHRLHSFLSASTDFIRSDIKKHIIQHCIYGVDKDGGAVDIARLRFWLALIVDEDNPEPLPNLDYKIMQGDSLLESFEGIPLDKIGQPKETQVSVKIVNPQIDIFGNVQNGQTEFFTHDTEGVDFPQMLDDYFEATNLIKIELHRQIDKYVLDNIYYNLEIHSDKLKLRLVSAQKKLYDKLKAINNELQRDKLLESKEAKEIDKLKVDFATIELKFDNLKSLQDSSERPFFLWHTYFKDVFDEGGFDIVIGNPPYVQLQKMAQSEKLYGSEGFETYSKSSDIYCLFYEKGVKILRKGGVLAYITSNSWLQTKYGAALRQFLREKTDPLILLNFEDTQLFQTATVETNILLTKCNSFSGKFRAVAVQSDLRNTPIAEYANYKNVLLDKLDDNGWIIADETTYRIKLFIEENSILLRDWDVTINFGIKTGYNEAFIIDEATRDNLVASDAKNIEILKPLLRGRDVQKFHYYDENLYLIFIPWHFPLDKEEEKITGNSKNAELKFIKDYQSLYQHLLNFKKELTSRNQSETGIRYEWYVLQRWAANYYKDFEKQKIIWSDISDKPKFVFDTKGFYTNDRCWIMTGNGLKYLLGILNSKLVEWYFNQISTSSGMGTNMWKKYKIEQLPIKKIGKESMRPFEVISDYLLYLYDQKMPTVSRYSDNIQVAGQIEDVLNQAVYELYFLEHLEEREIDVIQFLTPKHLPNLEGSDMEKAEILREVFTWLLETGNPVRTRIQASNIKSPNLLRVINSATS